MTNKRLQARRATQIMPATGWYARLLGAVHSTHADGSPVAELTDAREVGYEPLVCWALDGSGAVSGRVAYHDGCINDPSEHPDFRGYVFAPDGDPEAADDGSAPEPFASGRGR